MELAVWLAADLLILRSYNGWKGNLVVRTKGGEKPKTICVDLSTFS